jgi:hypothetical protein
MRETFRKRLNSLGYKSYRDYLRSEHWASLKEAYRKSTLPQECIGCRSLRYQLHHRSYARIGREQLTDLLPLCGECHRKVHDYERIHGTRVQETHAMLRSIFGWTKVQARDRLAPFSLKGFEETFAWVEDGKKPLPIRRKGWDNLPVKFKQYKPTENLSRRLRDKRAKKQERRPE